MAARKPTLNADDLATKEGTELFQLCCDITADGRISKEDIVKLRTWLNQHATCRPPAADDLRATLEFGVQDNVVTKEEARELYRAIEKVLPATEREKAASKRRIVEAEQKNLEALQRELAKKREKEAQERSSPVLALDFMVAGVRYDGRGRVVKKYASAGQPVRLVREPENRFSIYAVKVCLLNGLQIGYVPEEDAEKLASLLDQGYRYTARITKILTRADPPIPVVEAFVYRPDADVDGLAHGTQQSYVAAGVQRTSGFLESLHGATRSPTLHRRSMSHNFRGSWF